MAKVVAIKQSVKEANAAEENKEVSVAIQDYEAIIKANPLTEKAYDRLMIIYRKQKEYTSELRIIDAGINAFDNLYKSKKSGSKKIVELSNKLNRSFGLTDKKGNEVYEPEPIARWKKRKVTVLKRIK